MNKPLRIVVADDEPDMREFYRAALPRLGHVVVAAAENGRDLIEQCRSRQPDLVITDIKMSDLDGIEAALAIYQEKPVPIILVSAHHDAATIERAEAANVMGYLVKPVRTADLAPAIAIARRRFADAQTLRSLSLTDDLTGLSNRRGFLILAEQQMRLARRNRQRLSLLFIDMDGLKRINDLLGHPAGDQVLRATAAILRKTFRSSDIVARYGGDEFCVLAIDDSGGASVVVERLLKNIEDYNAVKAGQAPVLSLSMGAVVIEPTADEPIEKYLAEADRRMYEQKQAKRQSRA